MSPLLSALKIKAYYKKLKDNQIPAFKTVGILPGYMSSYRLLQLYELQIDDQEIVSSPRATEKRPCISPRFRISASDILSRS